MLVTHSWGTGQGHHQQVLLACSAGKSCSQEVEVILEHRDRPG